jgi:hypothetical protein
VIEARARSIAAALAMVLLPALAAVPTTGADAKRTDSGLHGTIRRLGDCRPGSEPLSLTCTYHPVKATVRVLRECDRHEVKRFTSRARDGHYRVRLKPGRYVLDPLEGSAGYFKGRPHVRVRKHEFLRRDLTYSGNTES